MRMLLFVLQHNLRAALKKLQHFMHNPPIIQIGNVRLYTDTVHQEMWLICLIARLGSTLPHLIPSEFKSLQLKPNLEDESCGSLFRTVQAVDYD